MPRPVKSKIYKAVNKLLLSLFRPHKIIERRAKIDFWFGDQILEASWNKKPRRKLRYVATSRTPHSVRSEAPIKGEVMYIHTHPHKAATLNAALPSRKDLKTMYTFGRRGIRTYVISRVNEMGNEIGRTIIRPKKPFYESEKRASALIERYCNSLYICSGAESLKYLEHLKEAGFISIRFVPMKGYKFNKSKADFEPIHKKRHIN